MPASSIRFYFTHAMVTVKSTMNNNPKKSFPFSRKREHKILSTLGNILLNRQPYGWNTTLK